MVFSSNVFLFLFLPIFLLCYYATPTRLKSLTILIGSYMFYAWWRVDFLALFIAVTAWNYVFGHLVARAGIRTAQAKKYLIVAIIGNLATLGYFKYANFGVDSFNAIVVSFGMEPIDFMKLILPIGISFYIFQAISYVIDVYRGDTEATHNPIDFAAFIALFPQLIAGPVLRYKDLADQFTERTHTVDKFSEGVSRFMMGFVKKVFIADTIAGVADSAFALSEPTAADAWLGAIAYAAQLYFDFSGYSDMAIGLGLMMGFRFMENFNQPYISHSITEFWRRWHISLSSWLKDYLYIPLGGNRNGTFQTYRNLFLTMLLGGLWHGANWTFIIWGAWQGMWLAIERALGLGKDNNQLHIGKWLFTFFLVLMGWVMFRAVSLESGLAFYGAMFSGNWSFSEAYLVDINRMQVATLILAYAVIIVMGLREKSVPVFKWNWKGSIGVTNTVLTFIFVLSLLKLSAQSYSPFLYFQF